MPPEPEALGSMLWGIAPFRSFDTGPNEAIIQQRETMQRGFFNMI